MHLIFSVDQNCKRMAKRIKSNKWNEKRPLNIMPINYACSNEYDI